MLYKNVKTGEEIFFSSKIISKDYVPVSEKKEAPKPEPPKPEKEKKEIPEEPVRKSSTRRRRERYE